MSPIFLLISKIVRTIPTNQETSRTGVNRRRPGNCQMRNVESSAVFHTQTYSPCGSGQKGFDPAHPHDCSVRGSNLNICLNSRCACIIALDPGGPDGLFPMLPSSHCPLPTLPDSTSSLAPAPLDAHMVWVCPFSAQTPRPLWCQPPITCYSSNISGCPSDSRAVQHTISLLDLITPCPISRAFHLIFLLPDTLNPIIAWLSPSCPSDLAKVRLFLAPVLPFQPASPPHSATFLALLIIKQIYLTLNRYT